MPPATFHFDLSDYAPGTRHPPHAHDELHLSLALRGRVAERVGSATEEAGALSAVVKDPGVTHADEFGGTGALMARLVMPGACLADLLPDRTGAPSWAWTHDPAAAAPFIRLVARAARGENTFPVDDADVVELLAGFVPAPVERRPGTPPQWLQLAMARLREEGSGSRSVREVARSAGVHPVYLARALRRWYGTTPAAELRHARLRSAAEAVAQGGATASRIAHLTGFADQPHFCRAFSGATGLTPGHFGRLVSRIQGGARRAV